MDSELYQRRRAEIEVVAKQTASATAAKEVQAAFERLAQCEAEVAEKAQALAEAASNE